MQKKTNKSYQKLEELSAKAALFQGIAYNLEWDQETYMPKNAATLRGKQLEQLAGIVHREKTSKAYYESLSSLVDLDSGAILQEGLDEKQRAALREWRRDYLQAVKLSPEFVEEFAKACSESIVVWQEARPKNDFSSFQPHLEKLIELNKRKADLLGYKDHPYDALIDSYEADMTVKVLSPLFERLKIPLTTLLKKIQTKPDPNIDFLTKEYPHDKQLAFGKAVLANMGFDKSFSRLDESSHPMCIPIHPTDVRMTTRIYPTNPIVNVLSCVHEGGHGLYHSNLPAEHYGTPLSEAASFGIDESQSRTWETIVGRSLPFWEYYFPKLKEAFPQQLKSVSTETFYKALNIVEPSLIRTDSDEVSYNLHIMIRYEIEKGFIEGTFKAKDLPDIWNEKMRDYLGITPKAHSEGCLQDIHWSMGAIGYFPTYTLGNLYAAQFFETFQKTHPDWKKRVSSGDLKFIADWQKEHIHQFGRQFVPEKLCENITGSPLTEGPFIRYLESKYLPLYDLT